MTWGDSLNTPPPSPLLAVANGLYTPEYNNSVWQTSVCPEVIFECIDKARLQSIDYFLSTLLKHCLGVPLCHRLVVRRYES
jgi:hypothetical protein